MLIFWHTFRSKESCWFFSTLCILYFTYRGGFAPRIGTIQNTKCAKKSTWFFGSKSVPKNQCKLHVINNYICKLWVMLRYAFWGKEIRVGDSIVGVNGTEGTPGVKLKINRFAVIDIPTATRAKRIWNHVFWSWVARKPFSKGSFLHCDRFRQMFVLHWRVPRRTMAFKW